MTKQVNLSTQVRASTGKVTKHINLSDLQVGGLKAGQCRLTYNLIINLTCQNHFLI